MTSERRYTEEETREIFERATKAQREGDRLPPSAAEGLTLAELQTIGREVGIPAELVAGAASDLDRPRPATNVKRLVGLPVGVGRTVELKRQLTEAEWERLVAEIRETFEARGVVRSEGGLRQWVNGNLQVFLEPSQSGHRLRLRTVKAQAVALIRFGTMFLAGSGALALVAAVVGRLGDKAFGVATLAMAGAAAIAVAAISVPGWARERARQMELIAARANEITG